MAKSLVKWWPVCFVVVFAGCATMTPEQCKNADWSEVGRRDGLDGHSMTTLDARISDCKEAGVSVDTGRYVMGREQGLLTYCQLDNAVVLGLSGAGYEGACPPMIDEAFRRAYEKGRSVFEWRTEVSRLENRNEALSRRLYEIGYEERRLIAEAGKEEDRKRVLKEFDQRRQQLRMELFGVDRSLQRARDALRSAEISLRNP
jgi:Protein of unknown function (DUF2799)